MEGKKQDKKNEGVVKTISEIPAEEVKSHEGFLARTLLELSKKDVLIKLTRVGPGGRGPVPPHSHPDGHLFIVLEGTLGLEINGDLHRVENGSCAEVPPGHTHQLRCIGEKEIKFLAIKWI
ncbi:MAG: cupin domain-containing protein [Thermodesulfobacteriota bacterium]|nr:cupin domain-containing protein [Thermodesulfobacteriota bacterium]